MGHFSAAKKANAVNKNRLSLLPVVFTISSYANVSRWISSTSNRHSCGASGALTSRLPGPGTCVDYRPRGGRISIDPTPTGSNLQVVVNSTPGPALSVTPRRFLEAENLSPTNAPDPIITDHELLQRRFAGTATGAPDAHPSFERQSMAHAEASSGVRKMAPHHAACKIFALAMAQQRNHIAAHEPRQILNHRWALSSASCAA
jgi:hypothetical protein